MGARTKLSPARPFLTQHRIVTHSGLAWVNLCVWRMGLFGEGTVEAGLSVSPTLVCGEMGEDGSCPLTVPGERWRATAAAAGRKAWPRWPL